MSAVGRTLLLAVLVLSAACRDLNVATGAYATLAEAEQAGAISSGLIPATLPKGAHDIREAHDVRDNRRWGLFSFPPSEADALRATLQREEFSLAGVTCDMPGRVEWWPVLLRDALDPEAIKTAGLKVYLTERKNLIVVVNWNQGRAYYWTSVGAR